MREVRDRIRRLVVRISQEMREFPSGMFLHDVYLTPDGSQPIAGGGFSDVHLGHYQGGKVAIKRLRTYVTDQSDGVRVCALLHLLTLDDIHRNIALHTGVPSLAAPFP